MERKEEYTDASASPEAVAREVSTISLQSRIPSFWRAQPKLWFAQFEAVVSSYKTSEDQKYNLVIAVLERTDIEQVSDIICNPPSAGKYQALKKRLLSVYEESESKQFQKLLGGLELGEQKPSQLLRVMRDLSGTKVADDALKVLWMGHLPSQVRAVLSVSTESSLDTMATMADKMMEHTEQTVAEIRQDATPGSSSGAQNNLQFQVLSKQIEKLTLEIAALKEDRSRFRGRQPFRNPRRNKSSTRSKSRNGRKPGDPEWECSYHYRFGDRARKCQSPCARRRSEN
ncbi:uncharacterized protein LOC132903236 [Amyelois transitella]|uniref:uncharacterized protein LOC132903236 n=1 Tax=Amyelois transitella TaxID=680683 RepID=UPI00298F4775|nr:uncharacterized protein LOC132903236 [Amyelois transitella]